MRPSAINAPVAKQADGSAGRTFMLEGVTCAGCILRIEKALAQVDGVLTARGNATTKRLRLIWDDNRTDCAQLTGKIADLGYAAFPLDESRTKPAEPSLLGPLAVAGFATMNIMALSVSVWFGIISDMGQATMMLMHWFSALLATPAVFYSGAVFYRPALSALIRGNTTMDLPIAFAILITYAASLFETLRGSEHVYYDAVVSLIFLLLIGRVLDQKLRHRSARASENLRAMLRVPATRITDRGVIEVIQAEMLVPGDKILVKAGEQIAADGKVLKNPASVDESPLTGEVHPVLRRPGDDVTAGCIVASGQVLIEGTRTGEQTRLSQMADLADQVSAHKGQMQHLADRFASAYVPMVLTGGVLGFIWWYGVWGASFGDALMIAVAVLVVTCPCAAGLATPAVTSRAANILLRKGVLLKSASALETLGNVTRVFADKTGTLSTAELVLDEENPAIPPQAAALAAASTHPLAQTLASVCPALPATNVLEYPGRGVKAETGARLGSAEFIGVTSTSDCPELWYRSAKGPTTRFRFKEKARQGLPELLAGLQKMDLPLVLLSGDHPASVRKFADTWGITHFHAALKPEDKLDLLQNSNDKTFMIGDGINDALALSGASVSASFSSASQIATAASDIVFLKPRLEQIVPAVHLAQRSNKLVRQNLTFATIYNLLAVPLALAGMLSPLIAALLMSSSSVIVLLNGLRLKEDT